MQEEHDRKYCGCRGWDFNPNKKSLVFMIAKDGWDFNTIIIASIYPSSSLDASFCATCREPNEVSASQTNA